MKLFWQFIDHLIIIIVIVFWAIRAWTGSITLNPCAITESQTLIIISLTIDTTNWFYCIRTVAKFCWFFEGNIIARALSLTGNLKNWLILLISNVLYVLYVVQSFNLLLFYKMPNTHLNKYYHQSHKPSFHISMDNCRSQGNVSLELIYSI